MKLAEALILRKDLQNRLGTLEERLLGASRVQEGQQPFEEPAALLLELDSISRELADLITRINLTNSSTKSEGKTLTALLARREVQGQRVRILHNLVATASDLVERARRSEIRIESTIDVAATRRKADQEARELRDLDMQLQALNWSTELL